MEAWEFPPFAMEMAAETNEETLSEKFAKLIIDEDVTPMSKDDQLEILEAIRVDKNGAKKEEPFPVPIPLLPDVQAIDGRVFFCFIKIPPI